jgi:hypothetical protein
MQRILVPGKIGQAGRKLQNVPALFMNKLPIRQ